MSIGPRPAEGPSEHPEEKPPVHEEDNIIQNATESVYERMKVLAQHDEGMAALLKLDVNASPQEQVFKVTNEEVRKVEKQEISLLEKLARVEAIQHPEQVMRVVYPNGTAIEVPSSIPETILAKLVSLQERAKEERGKTR